MQSISLLNQLIDALKCLPGVGNKSAQRMAYQLLDSNRQGAIQLSNILKEAMENIGNCSVCRDYSEQAVCQLCANTRRDASTLCIVESPSDVLAIESTASFHGLFFVLLGQLSPLDGIGPEEIGMSVLANKLSDGVVKEIIVATSSTIEGEATAHYIAQLAHKNDPNIKVTRLAQGVPLGGELGYLDQSTLALSIANRNTLDF
ncbi:MAG: recombination mediator RecR [Kangiellaceae bacterium]|nr:recombination mediator RecR [Kangiellaceae bacterium]